MLVLEGPRLSASLCTANVSLETTGFAAQHRGFTERLLKTCRVQLLSFCEQDFGRI